MTASRTRATNADRLADLNLQSCPGMAIRCPSGNTVHRTTIGLERLAGRGQRRGPQLAVADILCCGSERPLSEVKQTCRLGLGMSAKDPKRTLRPQINV